MTTIIKDRELGSELQELYLVNKQWLSDLQFLDTELEFLKKLSANNPLEIIKTEELNNLLDIETSYRALKKDILAYSHELEPLITGEHKDLNLLFIEKYAQLKERLADIFRMCMTAKRRIFQCTQAYLGEHNITVVVG